MNMTFTQQRDAIVERFLGAALDFQDIHAVYLGYRLGFYDALAAAGGATAAELALQTDSDERYAREWLEHQAVVGILAVEGGDGDSAASERRYAIPSGYLDALLDRNSINWVIPMVLQMVGSVRPLEELLRAYRSGAGVPYAAYGADMRDGISLMNRALFVKFLGSEWLPVVSDIHARLSLEPPARVADVACGTG